MESKDAHRLLLEENAALDEKGRGLAIQQEVVPVAGLPLEGDGPGPGRAPTPSTPLGLRGDDDRPGEELFPNQVFISGPSRERMMCLMLDDTLTTELNLTLPTNELQTVSKELAIQDDATETFKCTVSPAYALSPLSGGDVSVLQTFCDNTDTNKVLKVVKVPIPVTKSQPAMEAQKKRGGWPKGRKRKPETLLKPPKAPATGYVLYLNERRKFYKNIPFPEVTKLLGKEWSSMSAGDKRVYLERSEKDKDRYQQELIEYKNSDAYQSYQMEQQLKRNKINDPSESDGNTVDEDNEELYCQSCDQWFTSLHNKKEHLFGKMHFQNISGYNRRGKSKVIKNIANSLFIEDKPHFVDNVMKNFIEISEDRDREISVLRQRMATLVSENLKFIQEIADLQDQQIQANYTWEDEQKKKIELQTQVVNLLALPALLDKNFCVDCEDSDSNVEAYSSCNLFATPHSQLSPDDIPVLSADLDVLLNTAHVP